LKYKQAILVRVDLKMGKGKIAAQVAHAAVTGAELTRKTHRGWWRNWLEEGQGKVVLKVKAIEDLLNYKLKAEKSCLPVTTIEDRGLTQVPPGEITCLAIGPAPSNKLDEMTGDLPLL
jgi:PTH2 family peptidyl-tRNA hydrolase